MVDANGVLDQHSPFFNLVRHHYEERPSKSEPKE